VPKGLFALWHPLISFFNFFSGSWARRLVQKKVGNFLQRAWGKDRGQKKGQKKLGKKGQQKKNNPFLGSFWRPQESRKTEAAKKLPRPTKLPICLFSHA
jgi:hypothetical protein